MTWELELSFHQGQEQDSVGKYLHWIALRANAD